MNNTLGNNTIECKKVATIVSGRKNVARSFFRRKQLSTSAEMQQRCCCISALVLNCFRLKKDRATFFRPETIVASFLHWMVILLKVLFNHFLKRQFVVLHCHIVTIIRIFWGMKNIYNAEYLFCRNIHFHQEKCNFTARHITI